VIHNFDLLDGFFGSDRFINGGIANDFRQKAAGFILFTRHTNTRVNPRHAHRGCYRGGMAGIVWRS
jgi:hypothetical protein